MSMQRVFIGLAVLLGGCVGIIEEPGGSDDGLGPERRTIGPEGPVALEKRWLDDPAGENPLRRLTMAQLGYTIEDLTGIVVENQLLPHEAHRDGFVTFASLQVSSETQVRAFDEIAESIAQSVDLAALVDCPAYDATCVDTLLDGFGRLVFRGAMTADERQRYRDVYAAAEPLGEETAMRFVVQGLLSAPRFLYRTHAFGEQTGTTGYAMAEKLSYFLWSSTPDDALLTAAEDGELDTPQGRRDRALAMLDDPRARRTVDAFHRQWLRLDELANLTPDPELFPEFADDLPGEYEDETLRAAASAFFDSDGTLVSLLTAPPAHDGELAELYGSEDEPRAGVLMLGGTMSRLSTLRRGEPVYRGAFILEQVLCRGLELPGDLNVMLPEPDPTLSYRQQLETMTEPEFCAQCHTYINPLGFALDSFDALGRYRPTEDGRSIDTAVEISGIEEGIDGSYPDGPALLTAIAESDMAGECYAEKWFEFAMGRARDPETDAERFGEIMSTFDTQDRNLRALVLAIVESPDF